MSASLCHASNTTTVWAAMAASNSRCRSATARWWPEVQRVRQINAAVKVLRVARHLGEIHTALGVEEVDRCRNGVAGTGHQHRVPADQTSTGQCSKPAASDATIGVVGEAELLRLGPAEHVVVGQGQQHQQVTSVMILRGFQKGKRKPRLSVRGGATGTSSRCTIGQRPVAWHGSIHSPGGNALIASTENRSILVTEILGRHAQSTPSEPSDRLGGVSRHEGSPRLATTGSGCLPPCRRV